VFENRVLRGIFGWVTGERRKLHNEELRDLYPSPNIITIIKSRRISWAGNETGTNVDHWWDVQKERVH
jgi:hypothetical protein